MKGNRLAILLPLLLLNSMHYEVSGKKLQCHQLAYGQKSITTCEGDNVACITGISIYTDLPTYKICGDKDEVKKACEEWASRMEHKCKEPCDTDLCNNE